MAKANAKEAKSKSSSKKSEKLPKDLKEKLNRLKRDKKNLEERLAELKEKQKTLEEKRDELKTELGNARDYGDSFENQDIENINSELSRVEGDLNKIYEEIRRLEEEITKIEETINAIKSGKYVDDSKRDVEQLLQVQLKDSIIRELLDKEFEVHYHSQEIKEKLGITKVRVRFLGSDEHISFSDTVKTISVTSPLGESIMDYIQRKLKEELTENLLSILDEQLTPVINSKGKKKSSKLPKAFKEIIRKSIEINTLGLDKAPNDYLELLRNSFEKIELDKYLEGVDEAKFKNILKTSLRDAFINALKNMDLNNSELTLNLPEFGEVKVKLKVKK